MSTKREFLKQIVGLAVAPLVPVPGLIKPSTVDADLKICRLILQKARQKGYSDLTRWLVTQRSQEIEAAMVQGHEGPWTFEYRLLPNDTRRVLLDGKGVACG